LANSSNGVTYTKEKNLITPLTHELLITLITMPEGPECTQIANGLNRTLKGTTITSLTVLGGRFVSTPPKQLSQVTFPLSVTQVYCKGKLIVFDFVDSSQTPLTAFSTLGMTGQWLTEVSTHTALQLQYTTDDGCVGSVFYCDVRRFGTFMFEHDSREAQKRLNKIAPGFVGSAIITSDEFTTNIRKCGTKPLLKTLMDQQHICSSIGNYLVAEIFYATRLYPDILCSQLTPEQVSLLFSNCQRIIQASYDKGGVSIRDYKHVSGARGEYGSELAVYGKKKDPLGNDVVQSIGNHGRTIHWVPSLQMA